MTDQTSMKRRWVTKVMEEFLSMGFTFVKEDNYGRWQMREGEKVFYEGIALGDVLRSAGNDLEIPVD